MHRSLLPGIFACLTTLVLICPPLAGQATVYTIFGQVQFPDGTPAARASVQITASSGYSAETMTNEEGQYELPNLPAGRYRLTASDPISPDTRSDAVETDISRVPGVRVMVHLFLREAADAPGKSPERPVVSVPEMTRQVPKDAQKAYQKALDQKGRGVRSKKL